MTGEFEGRVVEEEEGVSGLEERESEMCIRCGHIESVLVGNFLPARVVI